MSGVGVELLPASHSRMLCGSSSFVDQHLDHHQRDETVKQMR